MRFPIAVALTATLILVVGAAASAPERLVMAPYSGGGWTSVYRQAAPEGWDHEQLPAGQTLQSFHDMLTDQGFYRMAGQDPAAYLAQVFSGFPKACVAVKVNGPTPRMEGGLRVAYGQVYCSQQRGAATGAVEFYKAISGDAALYVVNREFLVPASPVAGQLAFPKGQEREAAALLSSQAAADIYLVKYVYVCGGRSGDPRCK
jgi:hypothetical protein